MTPSDKLREIVEKTFPLFGSRLDEWRKVERDRLLSDLTALISENYVEKAKYDELLRQRDELTEGQKLPIHNVSKSVGILKRLPIKLK